jgi:hypothetical protein
MTSISQSAKEQKICVPATRCWLLPHFAFCAARGQRGAEGETRNKAGGKDPGEMAMSVSIAYSLGLVT